MRACSGCRSPAGDSPPGGAEPLVHRRPAARRAREDRQARRRLPRHGRHLLALRAVPRHGRRGCRSSASAAAGRRRSGRGKAPDLASRSPSNLAIVDKRLEKMEEIRRYLDVATRPARPDRELVPADRGSDRDHAVAPGAVRPARRSARRRRVDPRRRAPTPSGCSTRSGIDNVSDAARPSRLGRRPAPPLPARRGLDVHPPRQRLRRRRARRQRLLGSDRRFSPTCCSRTTRTTIAVYNVATGVRFAKMSASPAAGTDEVLLASPKDRVAGGARAAARQRRPARR